MNNDINLAYAILRIAEEYDTDTANEILRMYSEAMHDGSCLMRLSYSDQLLNICSEYTFIHTVADIAQTLLDNGVITRYSLRASDTDISFRLIF